MTLEALIAEAARLRIRLEARGDRLHVEAPAGVVTPTLRDQLTQHKPGLLALLAPSRAFVTLRRGPTLPVEAIELAIDLERRGFTMSLDACQQVQIEPTAALTETDLAAIHRWRLHLGGIVEYDADAHEGGPQ
jgi:hypothetical protein